ncbi:MAG: hypothetical protein ACRDHF_10330 [Tepidiformaceae bacterium]
MELAELLRAEDPAIAAEARRLAAHRQSLQIRHIGGHEGGVGTAPNPAFAVLAPFVGAALRSAYAYDTSRQNSRAE